MATDSPTKGAVLGFEGAIAGLPLSDVIQLKGHNRFSGCITVEYDQSQGAIFFRDGEIIHAELGQTTGEDAVYAIISWPGGKFSIQSKVTTTSRTITQNINYLLLEAHRRLDEGLIVPPPASNSSSLRRRNSIAEKIMRISGVTYATISDKQGNPLEDDSFEAKSLAEKGLALAGSGNQLGELFGVGEARSVAFQDINFHLLMFESRNHYLTVAIKGDSQLATVEADIRSTLSGKK